MRRLITIAFIALASLTALAQDQPGTVRFPAGLDSQDSLIRASNSAKTTLTGSLPAVATTIMVASTATFPASGAAMIDSEIFYYTAKTSTTFTGVTRGADSTTAATHTASAPVRGVVTAAHHNTVAQAVVATQTKLGSGSSTPALNTVFRGTGAGTSAWSSLTSADLPSSPTFSGTVTAPAFVGNCSACTGIGIGTSTGGSAAASLSFIFDSDNSGGGSDAGGILDIIHGSTTAVRVHNSGLLEALQSFKMSGGSSYFNSTVEQSFTQIEQVTGTPFTGGAGHLLETTTGATGGLFNVVGRVYCQKTDGKWCVGGLFEARTAAGVTNNTELVGLNAVLDSEVGHTGIGKGFETDFNWGTSDAAATFTNQNSDPHFSAIIVAASGGRKHPYVGYTLQSNNPINKVHVGLQIASDAYDAVGAYFGRDLTPGTAITGEVVVGHIADRDAFRVMADSTTTGNAFNLLNNAGASIFSVGAEGTLTSTRPIVSSDRVRIVGGFFESYKDATPSFAGAAGFQVPGGALQNDYIFSTYTAGGGWAERLRLYTGSNALSLGAAVNIQWGSGAPAGACTTGSIYLRTNGGTGSTLYACESTA